MVPLGFVGWICMQSGFVTQLLTFIFAENSALQSGSSLYVANAFIAIVSFFSSLIGMYFVAFSKEKVEDEMLQRIRLDSFMFSALVQLVSIITGFILMILLKEPGPEGMLFFFIAIVFLFWLCFIVRFNYILHIRLTRLNNG